MKKCIAALLAVLFIAGLAGCSSQQAEGSVRLVLDWTPNTNHTGIYAALDLGYYEEAGFDVEVLQPPEGGALSLLGAGDCQYAVTFQEEMGPAIAMENPLPIIAVATILEHNTSGIVSLKSENIQSPKDLEGKNFATWDTPLVHGIMADIMENDGGDFGQVNTIPLDVTDVVSALQSNVDAVWIYYGWDGIATELAGLETNYFEFRDLDPVFDFYTPVLAANSQYAQENPEDVKAFMAATTRGYEYAIANPDEAAEILLKYAPELDPDLAVTSQRYLSTQYQADAGRWGYIDAGRWGDFYDWMYRQGLLASELGSGGFTNEYLGG